MIWREHELLWLEAALTLDRAEQPSAFHDIASMTGHTAHEVRNQAFEVSHAMADARWRLFLASQPRCGLPPSSIPSPTKRQLMGAR